MASLYILRGDKPGQRVPLTVDKTVLGRNPDCDVVISGTAVSRAHAHILHIDDDYYIEDLHSRNKTFVNNQEIAPDTKIALKDNDQIKICDFVCTFQNEPSRKPLPEDLRPAEPEAEEELAGATTVEASLSSMGSHVLLETQPAEKLNALLEISGFLRKTLEMEPLLTKIVDSLFQLFKQADRGFLILRDETTGRLMPKVVKTRRPHQEISAHFSRRIVNMCLEGVQALLSDDASGDSRFQMSQSIADFRIRSVMCAPLWNQENKAFGVIQLDTQDRTKKFTQDDLTLLMGVATQASIALENAKLHEDVIQRERLKRDLELAREVQRGFLPHKMPEIPGYDFFAYYEAAQEVGGDCYDVVSLNKEEYAVILGDVAGKGVPAALLMAKISADARFCLLTEHEPGKAITKLNTILHQGGLTERFITLVAVLLNTANHSVILANAGHPSPLHYRRSRMTLEEAVPNHLAGLPIGVLPDQEYMACEVHLEPGDCILIFSDGVTDAMDIENHQLHVKGLYSAVNGAAYTARSLGERVVNSVRQHATGRHQHDDITLLAFGRTLPESEPALP